MRLSLSVSETLELALATAHKAVTRCLAAHPLSCDPLEASEHELKQHGWPSRVIALWCQHRAQFDVAALLKACERHGIRILLPSHADWPTRFAHLGAHAPRRLFVRGTLPTLPHIAIIGTRAPTPYGLRAVDTFVREMRGTSVAIVSGLALGTDGRAHRQALEHGFPTTAILGSSIAERELLPQTHAPLAEAILAAGGAVLSEIAPGQPAHPGSFPERNRLIAALCHALIVTEAKERSGTLITARIALELGREVLAVPGSIFSPTSVGTHGLLAAGARPCTSAHDVWKALAIDAPSGMEQGRLALHQNREDQPLLDAFLAHHDGVTVDQLAQQTGRTSESLLARLGLLELQGLIREIGPGRWARHGLV